ncbi:hypothetical protein M9194_18075 [Vibrio sp. S4M6]|uniref:hypothetical protein n=1 Tax=Vibrio sinus TaxID=2946865 RepID=UPI00202A3F87|nr:hypothetical protein [Vibrio sinus]MCL9783342.1 hypothetical protein [Vibrio sinus]
MYLTVTFMYSLGQGTGLATTFAILGLLFDAVKNYSPTLIVSIFNKTKSTVILLGIICITLTFLSTTASIYSLQNGVESALSSSKEAHVIKKKIESLQQEITDLETLRSRQLSINHITQASATSKRLANKRAALNKTMEISIDVKSDSLLSVYSTPIILTISITLEILSIAMTLCLHCLEKKQPKHIAESLTGSHNSIAIPPVSQKSDPAAGLDSMTSDVNCLAKTEKVKMECSALVNPKILQDIKQALIEGSCLPTHRSVYENFRNCIRQKEVKVYMMELAENNIIRPSGNGAYVLPS